MTYYESDDVLYIRCSDGRTKRPDSILDKCTHQMRLAGGVLNAYFRAKFFEVRMSPENRFADQMQEIATMIGLKKPKKIIVASHAHCSAANALDLNHNEVLAIHEEWGARIREKYPHIEVEVLHEYHTECGTDRQWELVGSDK